MQLADPIVLDHFDHGPRNRRYALERQVAAAKAMVAAAQADLAAAKAELREFDLFANQKATEIQQRVSQ